MSQKKRLSASITEVTTEAGIEVMLFLLVTGKAESLQVTNIILTTTSQGHNVVNR
jgi:hypothetical protein